jgi:hypothetical protein
MIRIVSYLVPLVFLASAVRSLFLPDSAHWLMLAFVLASPVLMAWIAYHART